MSNTWLALFFLRRTSSAATLTSTLSLFSLGLVERCGAALRLFVCGAMFVWCAVHETLRK